MGIRIGTAEIGGTFHSQGESIKAALQGLFDDVDVIDTPTASIGNAMLIGMGEIEFGLMAANWVGLAQRGEPPFDTPIDLRIVAPMNVGPIFFIVHADDPIYGIKELRGRRVAVGAEGSGMVQHAYTILEGIGLGYSEIEPVYVDFVEGAEMLMYGEVDAQIQCPMPNVVMTRLMQAIPVRPLFYRSNELELLLELVPHYRRTLLPAGLIEGMEEDMPQPGVTNLLVTGTRVDPGIVRDVLRAILIRRELLKTNKLFTGFDQQFAPLRKGPLSLSFDGVPLHEATHQIYRSLGLMP